MAFSACRQALDEYGIEAEYAERWEREPASSTSGMFAHGSSPEGSVLWLRSGERFMRVRPRVLDTAQAAALWRRAALHLESVATLRLLADFEISYGLIAAHDGCILHSTLPWLECQRVALPQDWSVD